MKGKENCKLLGLLVCSMQHGIDKYFNNIHKKEEEHKCMPRGQSMMLEYLINHGDEVVYQKDLEKHFAISRATASITLKSMEQLGLVVRVTGKGDARLKELHLTEKAYQWERKIKEDIAVLEKAMMKGFSEEEITIFSDMSKRILQNLDELNGCEKIN